MGFLTGALFWFAKVLNTVTNMVEALFVEENDLSRGPVFQLLYTYMIVGGYF